MDVIDFGAGLNVGLTAVASLFSVACMGEGTTRPQVPEGVDHLVFAVPDLERGMDIIEEVLGVRPVLGGRHPDYGTHNALLSLGPTTYLEVIAADPELARPPRGRLFGLDEIEGPEMRTWAVRNENILTLASEVLGSGIGPIEEGRRERSDGSVLHWRLSDPYAMPHGGAIPFLISWGDTPHPASAVPSGGELVGLAIQHPNAEDVRESLAALGISIEVVEADDFGLIATIRTPDGVVELR